MSEVQRLPMKANALLTVILLMIVCTIFESSAENDVYTDQFVLHHSGGPDAARRFAHEQGFLFLDRVSYSHCIIRSI